MPLKEKKHVWRVGQRFRIVNARTVKRVGYDLHPDDFVGGFTDAQLTAALAAAGIEKNVGYKARIKLRQALAFAKVDAEGFGSKERKIIYWDLAELEKHLFSLEGFKRYYAVGTEHTVARITRSWTGTYYSGCSGYDSYAMEYYEESGGLDNRKPVVLLNQQTTGNYAFTAINAEDVEFIPREKPE